MRNSERRLSIFVSAARRSQPCSPPPASEAQLLFHCAVDVRYSMPKDLPGLYWDEEKKRYFPLASRPAGSASSNPTARVPDAQSTASHSHPQRPNRRQRTSPSSDSPPPKRQHSWDGAQTFRPDSWRSLNALGQSHLSLQRRRCVQ